MNILYTEKVPFSTINTKISENTYAANQSHENVIWKTRTSKEVGTAVISADKNSRQGGHHAVKLSPRMTHS